MTRATQLLAAIAVATLLAGCGQNHPDTEPSVGEQDGSIARTAPSSAEDTPSPTVVPSAPGTPPASSPDSRPANDDSNKPPGGADDRRPRAQTPQQAARRYITAQYSLSYRDPAPTAWLARVRPYCTTQWYTHLRRAHSDDDGRRTWMRIVRRELSMQATAEAMVNPEAPRTRRTAWVNVTYTVRLQTTTGATVQRWNDRSLLYAVESDHGWRIARDATGQAG